MGRQAGSEAQDDPAPKAPAPERAPAHPGIHPVLDALFFFGKYRPYNIHLNEVYLPLEHEATPTHATHMCCVLRQISKRHIARDFIICGGGLRRFDSAAAMKNCSLTTRSVVFFLLHFRISCVLGIIILFGCRFAPTEDQDRKSIHRPAFDFQGMIEAGQHRQRNSEILCVM